MPHRNAGFFPPSHFGSNLYLDPWPLKVWSHRCNPPTHSTRSAILRTNISAIQSTRNSVIRESSGCVVNHMTIAISKKNTFHGHRYPRAPKIHFSVSSGRGGHAQSGAVAGASDGCQCPRESRVPSTTSDIGPTTRFRLPECARVQNPDRLLAHSETGSMARFRSQLKPSPPSTFASARATPGRAARSRTPRPPFSCIS